MIRIVVGEKGKGKTKVLLENANSIAKTERGLAVYMDKNKKHIYELDNRVRLINVCEYCEYDLKTIKGFLAGLVAGNHDISVIYIDSFLTLVNYEFGADLEPILKEVYNFSEMNEVEVVLSISANESRIPACFKDSIIATL